MLTRNKLKWQKINSNEVQNIFSEFPFDLCHSKKNLIWLTLVHISLTQFLLWFCESNKKIWRLNIRIEWILHNVKRKTVKILSYWKRLFSNFRLKLKRINVWHHCRGLSISELLCLKCLLSHQHHETSSSLTPRVYCCKSYAHFLSHTYTKQHTTNHLFVYTNGVCLCLVPFLFLITLFCREAESMSFIQSVVDESVW